MNTVRLVMQQEQECCKAFYKWYGQPSEFVLDRFPPAVSYADYQSQQLELDLSLAKAEACSHIRDVATRTHKTLCGNDAYEVTAKRIFMLGGYIDPDTAAELAGIL